MERIILAPIALLLAAVIGIATFGPHARSSNAQPIPQDHADRDPMVEANASTRPKLVGRQVCGECHSDNFQWHSHHGHAATLHSVANTDLPALFAGTQFEGGVDYGTYRYSTDSAGNLFVTLQSKFGDEPFPLQYVLGSGLHAQTMLTLIPTPDGQTEGIEHRVSRYPGNRIALTPGHSRMKPQSNFELFGDLSEGQPLQRCIYCHTTRGELINGEIKNLIPNVNCEKCHGPGSEHVRLARMVSKPPPYSVGKATWDAEAEIQLCGDCHRLPRSVSEKEIREYPDLLIRFQPIGMLRSRCYLDSNRQLKCTTCHNPHQSIREMTAKDHVQHCLSCHRPDSETHVACPVEPETGCIECHMPAIELNQELTFHDHWIRVRESTVE